MHTLMTQSQRDNRRLAVTGGLVYLDRVFMQYLEGPAEAVDALFGRIQVDARHHDVKLLERRLVPRRMFCDWSMGLLAWTESTTAVYCSFSPGQALDLYETDPSTAAPLFRAWAASGEWHH